MKVPGNQIMVVVPPKWVRSSGNLYRRAYRDLCITLAAIVICAAIIGSGRALASEVSERSDAPALSSASEIFVLGNVVFALLHEFGHAVISDFEVPLLGLEENSADTIAAVSLILLDRQHPDAGFSAAVGVTALVQAYVWDTGIERDNSQVMLWVQHGLSAQRYARLICLLYGSDPDRFGWVAEAAEMEEVRAEGCEDEWQIAEHAVLWLYDTYGVPPDERKSRPAASIDVRYGPPLDTAETAMLELLQRRNLLERMAGLLETRFSLPEPQTLKLSHCRIPNAYWDPEYREVVLCYELMTEIRKLADRPDVARLVERFRASQPQTRSSVGALMRYETPAAAIHVDSWLLFSDSPRKPSMYYRVVRVN